MTVYDAPGCWKCVEVKEALDALPAIGRIEQRDERAAPHTTPYAPTVSRTRSTETRWRLKSITFVSIPSARPMSWGRWSTGMLYSVALAASGPAVLAGRFRRGALGFVA